MKNSEIRDNLWNFLEKNIPRILSQLDRDCHSPTFGSFDRNFWHYKIRDFSSMTLQQGIVILQFLKNFQHPKNFFYKKNCLETWINAGLSFWVKSQLRTGAFNEYYPNEQGFPPTAFSLYAVGIVLRERRYKAGPKVRIAVQKAINWLLKNPEKKALNQEMAGLAGIALCQKIDGIIFEKSLYENRLSNFFNSQSPEGWFSEYGGPDIGYLSVTIDCLCDYYLETNDIRALLAAEKAIDFIHSLISVSDEISSMINSRNTGYILPYGITYFALKNKKASDIISRLFSRINNFNHFLNKMDDRYLCHYIFQSCFRALKYINLVDSSIDSQVKYKNIIYKEAGIYCKHNENLSVIVNAKKGGIVYIYKKHGLHDCDFGRRIIKDKTCITTHSHNFSYICEFYDEIIIIQGMMMKYNWIVSSPAKHIALRLMSSVFGNKLIAFLKNIMIFREKLVPVEFTRKIIFNPNNINIRDEFKGNIKLISKLEVAPSYSLRYVASSGSFEFEEFVVEENKKMWNKENNTIFSKVIKV